MSINLFSPTKNKMIKRGLERVVINRTTRQYKDFMGKRFVAYSLNYAMQKGVKPQNVTLQLTGQMLKDFYVEVKDKPALSNIVEGIEMAFDGIYIK